MADKKKLYDYEKIEKTIKRLGIPRQYWKINLNKFFTNDFYWMLSIRKDAGKTTMWLLLGLVLNFHYGTTIEYLRCDSTQLVRKSVETMFDVIRKYKYISTLWNGEYNDIIYKPMLKKWQLVHRDEDGNIDKVHEEYVCVLHSLENYINDKSSYNNVNGNLIVLDEVFDSNRSTHSQMLELMNQISTIGRDRPEVRVVMLGNNTNQYSFWFEEFCIEELIPSLDFGGYIEYSTELGTTMYIELIDVSEEKRKSVNDRKIRFYGFNTPKMNAFNGLSAWQGQSHPHIPDTDMLNEKFFINGRVYIFHRNKYIQLEYYNDDKHADYVFLHYAKKPKYGDNIILTLQPLDKNEVFGFGKFIRKKKLQDFIYRLIGLKTCNKWYYATNSVGDLVADYFREMDK